MSSNLCELYAFAVSTAAYSDDMGALPGASEELEANENGMTVLFECVLGLSAKQGGRGGRGAPYWEDYRRDRVLKLAAGGELVRVEQREIYDPTVPKYYADPWGTPYYYRFRPESDEGKASYELWSFGADQQDDAISGGNDDVRWK